MKSAHRWGRAAEIAYEGFVRQAVVGRRSRVPGPVAVPDGRRPESRRARREAHFLGALGSLKRRYSVSYDTGVRCCFSARVIEGSWKGRRTSERQSYPGVGPHYMVYIHTPVFLLVKSDTR